MYKKRTRTTQENTGNSKKRRLKYELYDSRFHKSYNNIKIGDYNDYSMNMNGGSNKNVPLSISSNNPNKKVIFYDDKGEVDKFIEKWFEDANNFKNMNGNNIIDVSKITSKFKSTFDVNDNDDNDDNYNKLLAQLFNKFNNHIFINSNIEPIIDNTIFTNDYITTILTQLNNETDNTVAVFEYDLYLYNLDTILKKYKTNAKFTTFFGNNDEDNYFNKHILNAKNLFGVNAIIENVRNDEDVDSDSGKKMKMYIPKLLTKAKNRIDALKGGANIDLRPTLDPYDITKLKKLENSNKTKSNNPADQEIRRITDEALWNTVLNDKKKHYGFEGETPKNLIKKKNETNKDEEFTLSNDKEIIEHYFRKCNDLQQLYINKHIELLDIFKKMNEYINLNDTINDIIKKLVDPKYFNAKGKDGKLKLPNPVITELKNLLKTQSMVKKVVGDLDEGGDEGEGGEQEREQEEGGEEGEGREREGEEGGEEGEGRERGGEEGGEGGEGGEGQGRNADLKNKYIVDKLEEYEFLQLIKQIQLSNETSIKYILDIKTDGTKKLDSLIDEYKKNITEKKYKSKKTPNQTETTWQSFNINNNNSNLYFNNSATLEKISSDPAEIQKVIYKCYDLQIVYLVKHIEVIEMFKLVYYYYDMMIKKIGILFFILSLYHKSDIDFTNVVIKLPLEKANVNEMIKKQTSLQQQTQSGGAITKEDIIDKLKTEIGEYKKTENSKYENKKTEYKTEAINNIKPLLDSTVPPPLKLFNHLLTYFKAFSDNQDNFKNYDYIDKLLIQLLKAILPEIAKTKNEDEYNKDEAKKIFNVVKTIYFDIIEQEINIHRKQDNVKKEKSSYGVVKIGQFSKMDYDISKTIAKNFAKLFKYRIEDEIDYSKDSYKHYTQYESLDKITEFILKARSLFKEQTPEKKTEAKEVIGTIENSMVDLFNSVEGEATITNSATEEVNLVGGANGKLHYISDAIGKNKDFNDSDIPDIDTNKNNDPQHIRTSLFEEYRLNFLDLLKNVYFSKDNKVDLKNMTIDKEIELLEYVLKRVRNNKQTIEGENDKSNVIYIKQSAFDVLKNQKDRLEKKKSGEAERLAKLEEAERQRRAQEEAERQRRAEEAERQRRAEEEAERQRRAEEAERLARLKAEEERQKQVVVVDPNAEAAEANRLKAKKNTSNAEEAERLANKLEAERLEAQRLEAERLAKLLAEKESILEKIKNIIKIYEKKKGNKTINDDLRALSTKIENTEEKNYPDNGLTLLTNSNWWKSRKSAAEITDEDTEICNQYYSSLLSILQGSALIYVNLKPKQDGGAKQDMFHVKYDTKQLTFKDLCKDKDKESKHGPYELIFPEENKKNEKLYKTLFESNENESKTVGFTVKGETPTPLEKQGLMTSIDNGKSVVLFGFGFSGSGKTYTLIEGGTGKSESDTSILYQFIENNKDKIDSIEFLEIYPDPDKPTFFVGTGKEGELKDIIHLDKTNDQIKEDKKYNTIKINETNISIDIIKTSIAEIEKHRREQLRILPTPNNPNSSRSFLQITIKLKNNGDKKGGQLVIFDMPGTESTVRIKEMMLGKESYVDNTTLTGCIDFNEQNIQGCFKFNKAAKDYFLDTEIVNIKNQEPKTDLEIKNQEPKTINTFNIILCNILYQLLKYKSRPGTLGGSCSISNLFEGFDDTIKNNHIQTGNIYTLVTIKYTKQDDNSYTISSVQAKEKNQDNTKTIMNVLFKYFILNIFKFSHLDIKLPLETDKRSECDNYIATIGFELACFFNKKSYSTYNDYFKQTILDEIVFLKDDNYKKIYDQFLKIILISENFSINDSDISLSAEISSDQKKKMMEIFGFKVDTDTEIKFTLTNEVFTQTLDNIKQLDNFFLNNTKTTHTKSIFIKYILFILSYIKQKSETLKTDVLKQIHTSSGNFNKQNIILIKATPIKPTVINPTYTKPLLPSQMDNNNIKEYAYAKAIYDIENMRLRASVYFIYKYIKFIVNQGSGIMTTLEHLKFFFLSRAGKIEKYNNNHKSDKDKQKQFTIEGDKNIFNKPETYTNKEGEIEEKINIGEMKKYGLISILQSLAGDETNLEIISNHKLKDTPIPNLLTPKTQTEAQTEAQPAEQTQNTTKSKFIMLAHINPFPNTNKDPKIIEEDKEKKCKSASDTLAYIDSISANNLDIISVGANTGGSYRKKKYYKDIKGLLSPTLKKNRLKRFTTLKKLNKNKKNLFTSKTKKLL